MADIIKKYKLIIIIASFILGVLFGEIWLLMEKNLFSKISVFIYSGLYWWYIGASISHTILMYITCFLKSKTRIKIVLLIIFPFGIAIFWGVGVLSLIPYLIYSIVKIKSKKDKI